MNNVIHNTALILTIIGGLNWGLVGLFGFDLVAFLFGSMSVLSRIVYILVGASAMDDPPNFNTFNIVLASFALVIVCRVFHA